MKERDGQRWRILVAYPDWSQHDEDSDWTGPYRRLWIRVTSHLVKNAEFAVAYDFLTRKKKVFAHSLPSNATYSYGFAGEYPWATSFNTEPEEWHGDGGIREHLPVRYQPAWNHLEVEWEYDATLPRQFQMAVPARDFFTLDDLWWCGKGYGRDNAHVVFQNPSLLENGPDSLLADADDLPERLNKLGLRLIWTLVGEKQILGGRFDTPRPPQQTFSQVACLRDDGSVQFGERVFFVDDVEDTGTGKTRAKTRGRSDSRTKRRAGSAFSPPCPSHRQHSSEQSHPAMPATAPPCGSESNLDNHERPVGSTANRSPNTGATRVLDELCFPIKTLYCATWVNNRLTKNYAEQLTD